MEESRFTQHLLTLLLLATLVTSDDTVKIKFNDQTITSSTLKWSPPTPEGSTLEDAYFGALEYELPEGVTEQDLIQNASVKGLVKERKLYLCRAYVNGKSIPGALIEKTPGKSVCAVALVSRVHLMEKYEILQNVDKAARLFWTKWEKNMEVPNGAVLSGEYYIARSISPNFKVLPHGNLGKPYLIGKIEPNLGIFGKMSVVTENNTVMFDVSPGEVLVEVEPVMYDLSVIKVDTKRKKIIHNNTILGQTILRNGELNEMKVDSVIGYPWNYYSGWGPGRGMLKGLSTNIYISNNCSVQNIKWGLPFEEVRNGMESVEAVLPAGTACNVQVTGDYQLVEIPYTATLISVFKDSRMMNRTVHGMWTYTELEHVDSIYGPLYYINNSSLVPTTTTTTTEPPPSTTPSTTTMTNEIIRTPINPNDKKTTSSVKEDMQNDQNNALELNKDEAERSTAGSGCRCFSHSSSIVNSLLISLVFGYIIIT